MQRFFATLLARETTLSPVDQARLAERLAKPIGRMLVYYDPADEPAPVSMQPTPSATAEAAPPPQQTVAKLDPKPADAPLPPSFDPFAFSVIAVLKRGGRDALRARLETIGEAHDLRRLADAQHLALDSAAETLAALRNAIILGAEARIADRRAAAS